MVRKIGRDQVQRLMGEGAQVVEVLGEKEFAEAHLPGARNIPLRHIGARWRELDRARPVITYCEDAQCDLGPRAAYRLETLGFDQVFEYSAGKQDWLAMGLPFEGSSAGAAIGKFCRPLPACSIDERLETVLNRAKQGPVAVVAPGNVVLGLISDEALRANSGRTAAEAMREGPPTFRPNLTTTEIDEYLVHQGRETALVTTSEGKLLGLYRIPATVRLPEEAAARAR